MTNAPTIDELGLALDATIEPTVVVHLAAQLGLVLRRSVEPTGRIPLQRHWSTPDGRTSLVYVDDRFFQLHYLHLRGPDAPRLAAVAREALGKTTNLEEALEMAARASNQVELMVAVILLGFVARRHDERVVEVFRRALALDDVNARHDTLLAMSYAGWPQLRPLFEASESTDASDDNRQLAARLRTSLEPRWERAGEARRDG